MKIGATIAKIATAVLAVIIVLLIATTSANIPDEVEVFVPVQTTPSPTPSLTPSPTPEPLWMVYIEDSELLLPSEAENLQQGMHYNLGGYVESNYPIKAVSLELYDKVTEQMLHKWTVHFSESEEMKFYWVETKQSTLFDISLAKLSEFERLPAGDFSFVIKAESYEGDEEKIIAENDFTVENNDWNQLLENNFRRSYDDALEFFGNDEKFMFEYIPSDNRNITVHPDWENEYIIDSFNIAGRTILIHRDARDYYNDAAYYIENTYIRVTGNGVDSGVRLLEDMISTNNGSYVSRFVTDSAFISHHSFGTATDLNAYMIPNTNDIANREIIYSEVGENLEYNGIKSEGEIEYYDFTYTGEWNEYLSGVPVSCVNYLLYELAFYRAKFGWGFYYNSTCDAMHYSLTDCDYTEHDEEYGVRKVFEYIDLE